MFKLGGNMEDLYVLPEVYMKIYEANAEFFEKYDVNKDFLLGSCASILESEYNDYREIKGTV
jgi:hypothetical protein